MALFRKFFYKKPPDGLLEISESVYVFDYCFSTDVLEEEVYKVYILGIIGQLYDHFPDSSFMVFNFREGDRQSQIAKILCDYDMTIMEYPRQYEGCPILTMETIHHFLRSCESWYQLGQNNIILMHCERGGWPVLAFMLAALLIYRKQYTREKKTLDMIFKQAPRELLQLMSPLNPLPSQLRYLQYVSRRNVGSQWPPLDRALTLDCVILRLIPNTDGEGGCRPIFRIYGQDPFMVADQTPKVLYSTPKCNLVRYYKQADCELLKIDIRCHLQGDVVLECISLDSDLEREQMMFRVMFNTAFIRSNILMLNRDEVDTMWNGKDQFLKDFRLEILFSDMDASSPIISIDMPRIEDKDGLPIEAFATVNEIFSNVPWDSKIEVVNVLQQITASNKLHEILDCRVSPRPNNLLKDLLSGRSKFDPTTLPENDISSMTSVIPGKDSTSYESSMDLSGKKKMDPLETKLLSENNKITTFLGQGKQFISSLELSTDSNLNQKIISLKSKASLENDTENQSLPLELPMDAPLMKKKKSALESKALLETRSMEKKMEPVESKALPEKDAESPTSTAQAKESILSHKLSDDANSVEKRIETSETIALSEDNTKSLTSTAQIKESIPSHEPFVDPNSLKRRIEPQHLQVALQLPTQSKIISPRVCQAAECASVLYSSSLQGSSAPISRYPRAPTALGITSLLQDRAEGEVNKEVNHGVTVPPSSTLSPSVLEVPKPVDLSPTVTHTSEMKQPIDTRHPEKIAPDKTIISLASPPTPTPLFQAQPTSELTQPAVTQLSENIAHDKGEKSVVSLQPQLSSELMLPIIFQQPEYTIHDKSKKSLVSSPAPMPTLPEAIKNFILTPSHPTAAPPPSSSMKSSFSTPPSPPAASPPPSSFPETTSHSTVKNSFKAPPPPPPHPTAAPLQSPSSTKGSLSTLPLPTPPPPPPSSALTSHSTVKSSSPPSSAPTTPCLSSSSGRSPYSTSENSLKAPPFPPPPPPLSSTSKTSSIPPPPLSGIPSSAAYVNSTSLNMNTSAAISGPPPPPPPPPPGYSGTMSGPTLTSTAPPTPTPPPPASPATTLSKNYAAVPPVPPPPSANGLSKAGTLHPSTGNGNVPSAPGPPSVPGPPGVPFAAKGRGLSRSNSKLQKRSNLKPYHWLKLTRAMHGSLWAETQKPEEASKAPEFDMSELESLFSAAAPNSDGGKGGKSNRRAPGTKTEKVQLIELRRAYNCEIMLTKVKIPLPELMSSVLALDDSALDADQVENLIKFCPTKEEMELLRNYTGEKDNLGRCEQFFLELMKVPRVESKLRVFSFKMQFGTQVSELRRDLNIVNSASEEIRNSVKLKRIMQTILSLGNALNHGTARGAAIGFRLDSLLKLTDTRARNNKMTLMHYLCKVLAEKLPELLDFSKDLESLEASTKIQLKYLAEEMQAINKGLEKVVQELTVSENDGRVSENFCKILKEFLSDAEAEVRSLAQLYSNVGRNADALARYFGEDPARCPFEQVVSTLLNFVRMFGRAHEENCKQLEFKKKKATKEAENEKLKLTPKKESEQMIRTPIESGNIK